ncbi:MAG: hypothetical protein HZA01_13690 [Nitrospinae bacterium]|nr:hypothetical protein [Nitrospinota bacterium]
MDSNDYEKKLEKLSRSITEAILMSRNVRSAIQELKREEIIGPKSFLMLMMRMDSLADLVDTIQGNKKNGKAQRRKNEQFIDGKKLSNSEIEFYEYLAEKFDETGWMKENGITLG